MGCEQWGSKVDLYLDGELNEAEARAFGEHLRGCTACASAALGRVQLKRSVQSAGKRYEASAELRAKIAKNAPPVVVRTFGWWRWAVVAALMVIVAGAALYTSSTRENERRARVYSELADLHVATLASATPVDVLSSDRHTVKPWFQGKIPFTFNVPELQGSEFSLVGGRVAYFEQSSGAHLIFQVRQHKISVFIFPERGEMPRLAEGTVNELSFNVESWTENGLRYFVIGDASAEDIRELSKLLRSAR